MFDNMFHSIMITIMLTNTMTPYPETLRLVSLIYRHGDRAPEHTFPTNPVPISAWRNGLGALTSTGIRQQYRLGKYIRGRYRGFINEAYVASEIRVRSTDVDRTLMSAEAHLAGLYPPSGYQKWSETLLWQPIPVHTVPLKDENLIYSQAFCPRLASLYKKNQTSPQTLAMIKENRELFEYLSEKTGTDVNKFKHLYFIEDVIQCQTVHGYPPPSWYNDTLKHRMKKIIDYEYPVNFSSVESARLSGGPLLREITENMVDKSKNVNSEVKMFMYSAHEESLSAFLATLQIDGFNRYLSISYAATIFVELHESPSQGFYVKVLHKTLSMSEPRILTVKDCTAECPLKTFRALTKKYIPGDWKKECEIPEDWNDNSNLSSTIGFMVLCYLSGVVTVLVVMLIVMCVRQKGYREVKPM